MDDTNTVENQEDNEYTDQEIAQAWKDLWLKLCNIDPSVAFWNWIKLSTPNSLFPTPNNNTSIPNTYGTWFIQYGDTELNNKSTLFGRNIPSQQISGMYQQNDGQKALGLKYGSDKEYTWAYLWVNNYDGVTAPVVWVVWGVQWWMTEWYVEYDKEWWLSAWLTKTVSIWESSNVTPYLTTDFRNIAGGMNYTKDFTNNWKTTWSLTIWGWLDEERQPIITAWIKLSL